MKEKLSQNQKPPLSFLSISILVSPILKMEEHIFNIVSRAAWFRVVAVCNVGSHMSVCSSVTPGYDQGRTKLLTRLIVRVAQGTSTAPFIRELRQYVDNSSQLEREEVKSFFHKNGLGVVVKIARRSTSMGDTSGCWR